MPAMQSIGHIALVVFLAAALLSGCGKEEPGPVAKPEPQPAAEEPGQPAKSPDSTAAAPAVERPPAPERDLPDVPARARELHQQSRKLGQAGDYEGTLAKLKEAAELAPEWPYPPYDMAFTYLLMGQPETALQHYKAVDSMMPEGFLTTKVAIWSLELESRGMLPEGFYRSYLMLEWAPEEQRRQALSDIVQNYPNYAPAWLDAAGLINDPAKRLLALNQGLAAGPDPETRGMLLINKAIAYDQGGERQQAVKLLETLLAEPDITFATRGIARQTLQQMKEPGPK